MPDFTPVISDQQTNQLASHTAPTGTSKNNTTADNLDLSFGDSQVTPEVTLRNLCAWGLSLFLVPFEFFLLLFLMLLVWPFGNPYQVGDRGIIFWASVMLKIGGIRIEGEGKELLKKGQTYVLASNHRSGLDPLIAMAYLRDTHLFGFMVKKSLMYIPLWGWFIFINKYIGVDRERAQMRHGSLLQAAEAIKKGRSLMIFPEGTRSKSHKFLPFKHGAATVAIQAGVPLVPISISGADKIWPTSSWFARPGTVRVRILPPIETKNMTADDRKRLTDILREQIVGNYQIDLQGNLAKNDPKLYAALLGKNESEIEK